MRVERGYIIVEDDFGTGWELGAEVLVGCGRGLVADGDGGEAQLPDTTTADISG